MIFFWFLVTFASAQRWVINTLQAKESQVDLLVELQWTFLPSDAIQAGDCIVVNIQNPYKDEEVSYQSFPQLGQFDCWVENDPSPLCEVVNEQKFAIKLSTSLSQVSGKSWTKIFRNPFSTRTISGVTVTLLKECDEPLFTGETSLPTFVNGVIETKETKIESNSEVIADTGAQLKISFRLQTQIGGYEGQVKIKSPQWYLKESILQKQVEHDVWEDSMINYFSEVLEMKVNRVSIQITNQDFDETERLIIVYFKSHQSILSGSLIELTISNFQNPVNYDTVQGFQITTFDSKGYLIDKSSSTLQLNSQMSKPQEIFDFQVDMLGDRTGQNEGQIITLQKFKFSLSYFFPTEPFCYFVIQFPPLLKLETHVQNVEGTGIFQPSENSSELTTGSYGQYKVDPKSNSIRVEGCRTPQMLNKGTLLISWVRMPDYIKQPGPITLDLFADVDLLQKVGFSKGVEINLDQLKPGVIYSAQFLPSNFYASAQKVAYDIVIKAQHIIPAEGRIVIQMPKEITMDSTCSVVKTEADCQFLDQNTIVLTNLKEWDDVPAGVELKFRILSGTNPIGSKAAGSWAVWTEVEVDSKYYKIDYQEFPESFTAKIGQIFSSLDIKNKQVSQLTDYLFKIQPEHDIPTGGKLYLTFPSEVQLSDQVLVESQFTFERREGNMLTLQANNLMNSDNAISIEVKNVQNLRSTKPSSSFTVRTFDSEGYAIDSGGQDIIIQLKEPVTFSVKIKNQNLLNGDSTEISIQLDLDYSLLYGDTIVFDLPQDIQFSLKDFRYDSENPISCEKGDKQFKVIVQDTIQRELKLTLGNLINPPSFKPSSPFNQIEAFDQDGYQVMTADNLSQTFLQTSEANKITKFTIKQDTLGYNEISSITIQFETLNAISQLGSIVVTYPSQVSLFEDTFCRVTTIKQIYRQNLCIYDKNKRTIKIQQAFTEVLSGYQGLIQIQLSKVRNPESNKIVPSWRVETFDDNDAKYGVDYFEFEHQFKCVYPCKDCEQQSECKSCWNDEELPFLSVLEGKCLAQCPIRTSTNGTKDKKCIQCDPSCDTCRDIGQEGDIYRCLTCAKDFTFFLENKADYRKTGIRSGECLVRCKDGFFGGEQGQCIQCASQCKTCEKIINYCTSCDLDSPLPAFLNNKCVASCPSDYMRDARGHCHKCESPCLTCESQRTSCTSCDGTGGLEYLFGYKCFDQCPVGTQKFEKKKVCTGCKQGCQICDDLEPEKCLKCDEGFLVYGDDCFKSCPPGTKMNKEFGLCRLMADVDAKLVYFPFLVMVLIVVVVNWIGSRVKAKHVGITNLVVLLSAVEHIALLTQVVLSFIFSQSINEQVLVLVIWTLYLAQQIGFVVLWKKKVRNNDQKLMTYEKHSDNKFSSKVRTTLAITMNWKFHKLLYSHFFGAKVKSFKFSNSKTIKRLFIVFVLLNCCLTQIPLLLLNLWLLNSNQFTINSQLQIMQMENMIISALSLILTLIEYCFMTKLLNYLDQEEKPIKKAHQRIMTLSLSSLKKHQKIQQILNSRQIFTNKKLDELLILFGNRLCKSDPGQTRCEVEEDERLNYSYPLSPAVKGYRGKGELLPFGERLRDNCYAEVYLGPKEHHLLPNLDGLEASTQKGGAYYENESIKAYDQSGVFFDDPYQTCSHEIDKVYCQRGNDENYFSSLSSPREPDPTGTLLDINYSELRLNYKKDETLSEVTEVDEENRKKVDWETLKFQRQKKGHKPDVNLRNFNEIDILGQVERDGQGNPFIMIKENNSQQQYYVDQNNQKVTSQGYLIDEENHIISKHDSTQKLFSQLLAPDQLPAPFFFERFNFNPFSLLGNFKQIKKEDDLRTLVKREKNSLLYDDKKRPVNQEGFLVNLGSIINQKGKVVFDCKQLQNGCLPPLYNWQGKQFHIFEVMGSFEMNAKNQIRKFCFKKNGTYYYQDMTAHHCNEKGYLINQNGDVVTRRGKVIFLKQELKNGEFPKIFAFSKLDTRLISGVFKRDSQNKPILKRVRKNIYRDDIGNRVSCEGYLLDQGSNITDRQGNILFEKYLLSDELKLPKIFQPGQVLEIETNEEDFSDLIKQFESGDKQTIASFENDPVAQKLLNLQIEQQMSQTMRLEGSKSTQQLMMNRTGQVQGHENTNKSILPIQIRSPSPILVEQVNQPKIQGLAEEVFNQSSNQIFSPLRQSSRQLHIQTQDNFTLKSAGGLDQSPSLVAVSVKNLQMEKLRKRLLFPHKVEEPQDFNEELNEQVSEFLKSQEFLDYKCVMQVEDFSDVTPNDTESFVQLVNHMYKSDFFKQRDLTPSPTFNDQSANRGLDQRRENRQRGLDPSNLHQVRERINKTEQPR